MLKGVFLRSSTSGRSVSSPIPPLSSIIVYLSPFGIRKQSLFFRTVQLRLVRPPHDGVMQACPYRPNCILWRGAIKHHSLITKMKSVLIQWLVPLPVHVYLISACWGWSRTCTLWLTKSLRATLIPSTFCTRLTRNWHQLLYNRNFQTFTKNHNSPAIGRWTQTQLLCRYWLRSLSPSETLGGVQRKLATTCCYTIGFDDMLITTFTLTETLGYAPSKMLLGHARCECCLFLC